MVWFPTWCKVGWGWGARVRWRVSIEAGKLRLRAGCLAGVDGGGVLLVDVQSVSQVLPLLQTILLQGP